MFWSVMVSITRHFYQTGLFPPAAGEGKSLHMKALAVLWSTLHTLKGEGIKSMQTVGCSQHFLATSQRSASPWIRIDAQLLLCPLTSNAEYCQIICICG